MSIFEIMGPTMIGPSSSHTAGAVQLGRLARFIAGDKIEQAIIKLHGSFASTSQGHGTDRALLGGLLGFKPDDPRIRDAFQEAEKAGLEYSYEKINLRGAHPNTVLFCLKLESGNELQVRGASIGGAKVCIEEINSYQTNLTGRYPTLWVIHQDRPGMVGTITSLLGTYQLNIANMQDIRKKKGTIASSIIELDQEVEEAVRKHLAKVPGIELVRYLPPLDRTRFEEE